MSVCLSSLFSCCLVSTTSPPQHLWLRWWMQWWGVGRHSVLPPSPAGPDAVARSLPAGSKRSEGGYNYCPLYIHNNRILLPSLSPSLPLSPPPSLPPSLPSLQVLHRVSSLVHVYGISLGREQFQDLLSIKYWLPDTEQKLQATDNITKIKTVRVIITASVVPWTLANCILINQFSNYMCV